VEATLAESITTIGTYAFSHCTALEKVNMPTSVTTIGNYAFYNCNKLQEIALPEGLATIGNYAFYTCRSFKEITLPTSLTSIGTQAFYGNTALEKVTSLATTPLAISADIFKSCPTTVALHLPTGTVKAYKEAGWTMFTKIISPCPISLTINDEAMGSVALSDSVVNYGSSVTVQITPAENHKLKAITVNGTDVTADVVDGIYTIKNIEDATEIYVELEKSDYCAITLDDVTATFGAMVDLPIAMVNTYGITALQMDITLPEGVTPVTDDDGAIIATLNPERATASHTITASQMEDGTVKMVIFSSDNTLLNGDNGTIATLKVRAMPTETTEPGTITIDNILGVTPNARAIKIAGTTATLNIQPLTFIPGDANMSGTVTVSDIVATINHMFGKPQAAFSFDAADMNGDGEISIVDVVNIVNAIIAAPDNSGSARARIRAAANSESIRSEVSTDGDNTLMSLSLNGSAAYTAMQMDVELPEGATLIAATSGDDSHTIAWNRLDNGTVRIVAYSLSSATFDGETLLTIEVENANGTISVDNVSVATPAGNETSIGGTSADVNGTTGIGGTAEEIVSVRYFNEAGAELDEPQKGINIVVTEYAGGRIESKKVLKK
ncbi:MAG: leucine-rich repeat protein, partial [Bacteroidaceae bacterium]|nr:leucine-rich repeat protein [Bacteroidaceae bacterium]